MWNFLAAMYSTFLSPAESELMGGVKGSAGDLALASTVFAVLVPWMNEHF
ncbi:MAG: hypothetical protein ACKVS9_00695 [Phycisphaerae bacterium]